MKDPIRGNIIRWTFTSGPMAKKTFEHKFDQDGSVSFRMLNSDAEAKWSRVEKCEVATVGDDVYAISYLAPSSGYTLTVVLDYRTGKLVSFASNEKELSRHEGTFEWNTTTKGDHTVPAKAKEVHTSR